MSLRHEGKNATIYPLAKIIEPENLSLGDESIIADFCFIYAVGKGIDIGSFCNITEHCIIQAGGLVRLHNFVGLGPRTTILASSDDYNGEGFIGSKIFGERYRRVTNKDVILEKHVQIGAGSIILPGVVIEEGCQVGAGSLVNKSLPPWTLCYGSPCRPIRPIPKEYKLFKEEEFLHEYYKR